jgi:uncharacterized DUF497 family protein
MCQQTLFILKELNVNYTNGRIKQIEIIVYIFFLLRERIIRLIGIRTLDNI